jgi:hypothetical protein
MRGHRVQVKRIELQISLMASLPFRVSDCCEFECGQIHYRLNGRLFNDPVSAAYTEFELCEL